ncbi:hypothetical protein EMIHUDRAFT_204093 [Emiliania huxleyi CCMP1516]|uniref:Tubulin-specific chaperone A n=2 Tax=Emiliania huxleyi TaxID=2903 RepID=A0A0D3K0Y8_EMIH1|nr:hypothetical protein EMIHUDRAFT_204093 [Emiliania huxleyi CCMP1516]EOD29423.1 hypothetical protein EMIHUDRAFT_204093 [Emiliania huxleyi CCMP1516]|eukprot:XP_005781852.1 hypothetical protein EMIHUDRAFT_204093 [Emiliania huxleyi CCMP1516]
MEREASRRAEITRQHAGSLARLREAISHLGRPEHLGRLSAEGEAIEQRKASAAAAVEEKEAAIAVAKERLATRSERPDRERVHDEAQSALQNELRVLCSAAQELTHSICKCDDDLARVEAAKAKVTDDHARKLASLELESALFDSSKGSTTGW